MRLYRYIGPDDIRVRSTASRPGYPVDSASGVVRWLASTGQVSNAAGLIPVTFVVLEQEKLLIADRRSEHVVCAGGAPVLSAVLLSYHCTSESLGRKFPGLASLLVTYFGLGKDHADDRVTEFFDRLCGSVRTEAMRAISIVWLYRAPTAPIPQSLMATINQLAQEGTGEIRDVAGWLLERAKDDG